MEKVAKWAGIICTNTLTDGLPCDVEKIERPDGTIYCPWCLEGEEGTVNR